MERKAITYRRVVPTTTYDQPPSHVRQDLASEWDAIACHEMGHALASIAFDIPLQRVWIAYKPGARTLCGWSVVGRTELVPDGNDGLVLVDDNEAAPFTLAGLEAEARRRHERGEGGLRGCRNAVWDDPVSQAGDVPRLELYVSGADFSRRRIEDRVEELLDAHWSDLTAAAAVLAEQGELSGRQVHELLPDVRNWRLR